MAIKIAFLFVVWALAVYLPIRHAMKVGNLTHVYLWLLVTVCGTAVAYPVVMPYLLRWL